MARAVVLLFCHDGMGLGHLRRISRLAGSLQQHFSTVVLCGMREASWIVPPECGLIKIPEWKGIDKERAARAGRVPWIDLSGPEAKQFRAEMIRRIASLCNPDVVIVDYLPLGQRRELDPFFASCNSLKYFLHRGLSDTSDGHILRGSASKEIAQVYDRILVASDPRLVDVATEDDYCQEARAKLSYVGFIGSPITLSRNNWSPTVVCSGGGGFRAEDLMLACIKTAESNPQIPFKIVLGPRSRLSASCLSVPPNCEAWQTRADLPELHRTAAIVISTGGYNSVLEAASGGARLIIYPNQVGQDDEQLRFAVRLSKYYPVRRLDNLDALPDALRTIWPESIEQCTDTFPLQMGGAERIGELLSIDLKARAALSPINRQSPCGGI